MASKIRKRKHQLEERRLDELIKNPPKLEIDDDATLEAKTVKLVDLLNNAVNAVVITGAGISTSANIPDYRGVDGLYTKDIEKFDRKFDIRNTVPTVTHMAIKQLIKMDKVSHLISQNCDGLHLRSGIPQTRLSEIHGNMFIEYCTNCSKQYIRPYEVSFNSDFRFHITDNDCPNCKRKLIDTIVHAGETSKTTWPQNWDGAHDAISNADLIIIMGTSGVVLKNYTKLWPENVMTVLINNQKTMIEDKVDLKIKSTCDVVMTNVMSKLGLIPEVFCRKCDAVLNQGRRRQKDKILKDFIECTCEGGPVTEEIELDSQSANLGCPGWLKNGLKRMRRMYLNTAKDASGDDTSSDNEDDDYEPEIPKKKPTIMKKKSSKVTRNSLKKCSKEEQRSRPSSRSSSERGAKAKKAQAGPKKNGGIVKKYNLRNRNSPDESDNTDSKGSVSMEIKKELTEIEPTPSSQFVSQFVTQLVSQTAARTEAQAAAQAAAQKAQCGTSTDHNEDMTATYASLISSVSPPPDVLPNWILLPSDEVQFVAKGLNSTEKENIETLSIEETASAKRSIDTSVDHMKEVDIMSKEIKKEIDDNEIDSESSRPLVFSGRSLARNRGHEEAKKLIDDDTHMDVDSIDQPLEAVRNPNESDQRIERILSSEEIKKEIDDSEAVAVPSPVAVKPLVQQCERHEHSQSLNKDDNMEVDSNAQLSEDVIVCKRQDVEQKPPNLSLEVFENTPPLLDDPNFFMKFLKWFACRTRIPYYDMLLAALDVEHLYRLEFPVYDRSSLELVQNSEHFDTMDSVNILNLMIHVMNERCLYKDQAGLPLSPVMEAKLLLEEKLMLDYPKAFDFIIESVFPTAFTPTFPISYVTPDYIDYSRHLFVLTELGISAANLRFESVFADNLGTKRGYFNFGPQKMERCCYINFSSDRLPPHNDDDDFFVNFLTWFADEIRYDYRTLSTMIMELVYKAIVLYPQPAVAVNKSFVTISLLVAMINAYELNRVYVNRTFIVKARKLLEDKAMWDSSRNAEIAIPLTDKLQCSPKDVPPRVNDLKITLHFLHQRCGAEPEKNNNFDDENSSSDEDGLPDGEQANSVKDDGSENRKRCFEDESVEADLDNDHHKRPRMDSNH